MTTNFHKLNSNLMTVQFTLFVSINRCTKLVIRKILIVGIIIVSFCFLFFFVSFSLMSALV